MMHIYLCQFPRLGARAPWSCPGENQYFCSYQPCSCSCSSRPISESILSIPTTRVGNVPPLSLSGRGRVLVYSTWRSLAFAALKLLPQNAHWRPNRHLKQEKYLHFFFPWRFDRGTDNRTLTHGAGLPVWPPTRFFCLFVIVWWHADRRKHRKTVEITAERAYREKQLTLQLAHLLK